MPKFKGADGENLSILCKNSFLNGLYNYLPILFHFF